MKKTALVGCLLALLGVGAVLTFVLVGQYNGLVSSEQEVEQAWAQVQNVYQRRADLVPNLVETVKGSAAFEQDTLTAVVEARSRVGHDRSPSACSRDTSSVPSISASRTWMVSRRDVGTFLPT